MHVGTKIPTASHRSGLLLIFFTNLVYQTKTPQDGEFEHDRDWRAIVRSAASVIGQTAPSKVLSLCNTRA